MCSGSDAAEWTSCLTPLLSMLLLCSPGFITSNLTGKAADGSIIKEFEASHGTVADMWHAHQRGEETRYKNNNKGWKRVLFAQAEP